MPLNLEDKKALVKEVAEIAADAQSVVAAEYRGITVTQMTELRAKARAQGVSIRVVKNTLARKALVGTSFEAVGPQLKGPLVLAFSKDDPGAAARVVKDFAKTNDKLVATLVSGFLLGKWMKRFFTSGETLAIVALYALNPLVVRFSGVVMPTRLPRAWTHPS